MSAPARTVRNAQISPDRLWVGVLAIGLVTVIMLASYVFSFTAIADAGAWTGVPVGVHWLAAIFIDGAILTYTVSLAVFQAREEPKRVMRRTRFFLYAFTAASVALNFAHTGSFWAWDFSQMEAVFGSLMAISAPLAALAASEEVVRLAFAKSKSSREPADEHQDRAVPAEEPAFPAHDVDEPPTAGPSPDELRMLFGPSTYDLAIEGRNEVGADVHDAFRG